MTAPTNEVHVFKSFQEFWPYYLGEHRLINCRILHYIGTIASATLLVYFLVTKQFAMLPLVLVAGYGPAWIGHFFIEKNRPATFTYPKWSFMGDYKMCYLAATGQLRSELSRLFGAKANQ